MSRPNISPIGNESLLIRILSFANAISSYVELSTLFSISRYTPGDNSLSSSINHCVFSAKKSLKSTPYSFRPCLSFLSLTPKSSLIRYNAAAYDAILLLPPGTLPINFLTLNTRRINRV